MSQDLAGTANDLTLNFTYNPTSQIATRTMSNAAYAYTPGTGTTSYANNDRNQVTNVGGTAIGYDGRQNITSAPMGTYGYNGANELTSATVGGTTTALSYDPGGRLYQSGATRFLYDGAQAIGEYNTSGGLLRRYVPGLGLDNVVTAYEGAGYDRRWLLADERGSVVSITDGAGAAIAINTYDEYGVPGSGNAGRFGYTGQMWLPEAQLYHYRARAYAPTLGRFMQTDPIGYAAGANIYAYVGADPMNWVDPSGLLWLDTRCGKDITIGVGDPTTGEMRWEKVSSSYECSIYLPDPNEEPWQFGDIGVESVTTFDDVVVTACPRAPRYQEAFENVLTATGYIGNGLTILGVLTANPVLIGVGVITSRASAAASVGLHVYQQDYGALAGDAAGFGAGLIPGGRLLRRFGGASFDAGRNQLGRFVRNHVIRRDAQDRAAIILQGTLASNAGRSMACSI